MSGILTDVFYFLVFPGLVFTALLGLALSWVDRKVTAMVQWRVGPPPAQPFRDFMKLLGKETILPEEGWAGGLVGLPLFSVSAAALAATIVWLAVLGLPASPPGDLIVVIYLLSVPALAVILGGAGSGNPLGAVGASREMKLTLAYELPFVLALLAAVFAVRDTAAGPASAGTFSLSGLLEFQAANGSFVTKASGILALIVSILCAQAKLGLVPFDAAEAECEIGEGALLEYSGPGLAMVRLSKAILTAVLPVFLVAVFWGGGSAPAFAGKSLLVLVLFVLVRNTNPRVRIDQALRFFWGPMTVLAALALALAAGGY